MHTHTTAGMAVACSQGGLSTSNFYSAQLHGKVAYHDFEGITVHPDEGPRLIANIGDKPAVILRNHGLLAWAESLPRAFAILWLLNRACEIQLASTAMGAGDRGPRGHPAQVHARLAAVQPELRRGPGRVRRAHARDRRDRPVVQDMKICVYGAGAIGGFIGTRLGAAGHALQRGRARRDARRLAPARPAASAGRRDDRRTGSGRRRSRPAGPAGTRDHRGERTCARRGRRPHRAATRGGHDGARRR